MNAACLTLCASLLLVTGAGDTAPLSLADIAAYQAALRDHGKSEPTKVKFTDLWNHPGEFRGRFVQVEGNVVLRFRQDAVGELPALEEDWLSVENGNLVCLVFPQEQGRQPSPLKAKVQFAGTFLKLVRYPGGDVERLAPLIVGPGPPVVLAKAPQPETPEFVGHWLDWTIGLVVAALVAATLAVQHLRRGRNTQIQQYDPPPTFVSDAGREGEGYP